MANLIIDSIGRPVEIDPGQWDALKNSIADSMKAVVGEVAKVVGAKTGEAADKTNELLQAFNQFKNANSGTAKHDSAKLADIAGYLDSINSTFKSEMNGVQAVMQEVADNIKSTGKSGGSTGGADFGSLAAASTAMSASLGEIQRGMKVLEDFVPKLKDMQTASGTTLTDIKNMASKSGSFFSHDTETHKLLKNIAEAIEKCCSGSNLTGLSPSPSPTSPASASATPSAPKGGKSGGAAGLEEEIGVRERLHRATRRYYNDVDGWDNRDYARINFLNSFSNGIRVAQQALLGFSKEMNILGAVKQGVIDEEVLFIKNTRAAAYEIQGVTADGREMQKTFTDIGKTVGATGFNRSDFQKTYLAALKSGIKDQKTALAVSTAQLNTEKQLGLEAGATGDMFVKWKTENKMSNMQIAEMGRGMRDVARFTGLTGEALKAAVGTANQFIKVMHDAGTLTSAAAKNLMEISANAQKLGVTEQVGPLLKAMSSTTNLFREASTETKAFLFQAAAQVGRMGDLMNGTVLKTKAGIKDMSKGMEMMLQKFGVQSLEAIDTLSDESKMKLNLQLKAAYGLELGELQNSLQALKESSKTLGDRLDDVRKKQMGNLTVEEKLAAKEEERRLKTSKSFEMLTALDEAAKGAKDMNAALAQFGTRQKDFEGDLKAMGKSWGSSGQAARGAIEEAIKGVNESLVGSGKKAMSIDSSEIEKAMKDPAAFRELTAKLTKAEQEAATAQKAAIDPMSKIEQGVNELNETLRNFSSKALQSYMNITGVLGLLIPAIGLAAAEQGIVLTKLAMGFDKHWKDKLRNTPEQEAGGGGVMAKIKSKLGLGAKPPGTPGAATTPAAAGSPASAASAVTSSIMKVQDDELIKLMRKVLDCVCESPVVTKRTKQADNAQIAQGKAEKANKGAGAGAAKAKAKAGGASAAAPTGGADTEGLLKFVESLKKDGPRMAKAAGILAAVAVGVIALGAVVMKISTVVLGKLNLDVGTVAQTAAVFGAIVVGAGLMAVALTEAKPYIDKLANIDKDVKSMVKNMWKGVGAFVLLSLPLVALAAVIAVLGYVLIDGLGLTPGRVLEITGSLLVLAIGITLIAAAMFLFSAAMEILGALAPVIWAAQALIWTGVGAFLLLAAPLLVLGLVLAGLGMVFEKIGLTPSLMMDITASLLTIAVGIGLLAPALYLFSAGLEVLGLLAPLIWATQGLIWLGVGAFLLLSAPLIVLGAVLAGLGKVLIEGMGLTPDRMSDIAESLLYLVVGIGLLAPALYLFSAGLEILGLLAPIIWATQGLIWLGVGAFLLLSAPLLALGAVLAGLGYVIIDEFGLTPSRMADIGESLLLLAVGVGLLAPGLYLFSAGLEILGLLAPIIWATQGLIWLGVAAFGLLSAPLLALGAVLAGLGYVIIDELGLTPSRMSDIGESFLYLAIGVAAIAAAMYYGAPLLAGLGVAFVAIAFMYGLLWLGAKAFELLTEPIMYLANTVARFGEVIIDDMGLTPARMEEISSTFKTLAETISSLAITMMLANAKLAILGVLYAFSMFTSYFVWMGVAAFKALIVPIKALAGSMIEFGDSIDGEGIKSAAEKLDGISNVITKLPPVFDALMNGLYPLTQGGWFFGKSPLQKIMGMRETFRTSFLAIAIFLNDGIVEPILRWFGDVKELDTASKGAEGIAKLIQAIPPIISGINDGIAPLMKGSLWGFGPSKMQKALATAAGEFRGNFQSILRFVSEGVIDPIFGIGAGSENINVNPGDIAYAAKVMKGLADMLPAIPAVVDALNGPIADLSKTGWYSGKSKIQKTLDKLKGGFQENFQAILQFVSAGIIDPIFGIGAGSEKINVNPGDIAYAAKVMKGLAEMLPSIPTVVNALNGPIADLSKTGWYSGKSKIQKTLEKLTGGFQENFRAILRFVSEGIIDPMFGIGGGNEGINVNPGDIAIAAKAMKGISDMLPLIPQVVNQLGTQIQAILRSADMRMKMSAISVFAQWFANVSSLLINGMIIPIKTMFPPPEEVEDMSARLDGMGQVVSKIPAFMQTLYENAQATLTLPGIAGDEITKLSGWFGNVASLLSYGIVNPIRNYFPAPEELAVSVAKLDQMGQLTQKIAPMAEGMGDGVIAVRKVMDSSSIWGLWRNLSNFMYEAGWIARMGIISPMKSWPQESEINEAVDRLTKLDELFRTMADAMQGVAQAAAEMSKININAEIEGVNAPETGFTDSINSAYDDIMAKQAGSMEVGAFDPKVLQDAGSVATEQMTKNATSLQGTMSELLNPAALTAALGKPEDVIDKAGAGGGFIDMISRFAATAQQQFGMGDTNALVDQLSKQSPEITQMQTAMRTVDTYTKNIKDLFERSSGVINDIKATTEYMSMFGDLDMYEKQISEKIASSKQFVPTIQRITENIGKGFDFTGGKEMVATIESQSQNIETMKTGLKTTEDYTKKLSDIFKMASNTVEQIRQATTSMTALESIKQVEANIKTKIASGNSFIASVLRTVEAVATNFGSNEEIKTSLASVSAKIQQAGNTQQVMTDAMKFIENIKKMQETVTQVATAAGEAAGTASGSATGGAGGVANASSSATGGAGGAGGAGGIFEKIHEAVRSSASSLQMMAGGGNSRLASIGTGSGSGSTINNVMQATANSSRTKNTTLGGGVPGRGMPHSIPGARVGLATPEPNQTAVHTAATNSNVQQQIMQERASASPPGSTPGVIKDNSELQGSILEGNTTAEQMLSVLKAMYQMMVPKSGSGGAGPGDTSTNMVASKPASYFRSPVGDLNSSSGKGATNMTRPR